MSPNGPHPNARTVRFGEHLEFVEGHDSEPWDGVDLRTGATVVARATTASPSEHAYARARDALVAQRLQPLAIPHLLPILLVAPRIVHPAPPREPLPRAALPPARAIACALQLCAVAARAHAAGVAGLSIALQNVVLVPGEALRICAVLPPQREYHSWNEACREPRPPRGLGAVRADLWRVAAFLHALLDPPEYLHGRRDKPALAPRAFAEDALDPALRATLERVLAGEHGAEVPDSAAALAALLAPWTLDPVAARAEAATLPVVTDVAPLHIDWDRLIAGLAERWKPPRSWRNDHTGELVVMPRDPHIALAAAYHQRACKRFAEGDLEGALDDVTRALEGDPYLHYLTTRAVIHGARGDTALMHADLDRALATRLLPYRGDPRTIVDESLVLVAPSHRARAHYVRGVARARAGDRDGAREDLARAVELDPRELYTAALDRVRA